MESKKNSVAASYNVLSFVCQLRVLSYFRLKFAVTFTKDAIMCTYLQKLSESWFGFVM
jgi:hypothetical protein